MAENDGLWRIGVVLLLLLPSVSCVFGGDSVVEVVIGGFGEVGLGVLLLFGLSREGDFLRGFAAGFFGTEGGGCGVTLYIIKSKLRVIFC